MTEALNNVQESKAKLQRAKAEILKKIEQQEAALGVFEEILEQSATRFTPKNSSMTSQEEDKARRKARIRVSSHLNESSRQSETYDKVPSVMKVTMTLEQLLPHATARENPRHCKDGNLGGGYRC